jgi:hypothetical protein
LQQAGQGGGGEGGDAGGASSGGNSAGGGQSSAAAGGEGGQAQGGSGLDDKPGPEEATATVQGCNDTEKVSRQLCEAATSEKDPFLRAALWDEYNQYKKILARQ